MCSRITSSPQKPALIQVIPRGWAGQERDCPAARGCHLPLFPGATTLVGVNHPLTDDFGVKGTFAGFLRIIFHI